MSWDSRRKDPGVESIPTRPSEKQFGKDSEQDGRWQEHAHSGIEERDPVATAADANRRQKKKKNDGAAALKISTNEKMLGHLQSGFT
jgi:hypothetical protein